MQLAITINVGLAIFNLLPIPPLDGFTILEIFLPYKVVNWIHDNLFYINILFLVLIYSGLLAKVTWPIIIKLFNALIYIVARIYGVM